MIHNELNPSIGGMINWINSVYIVKEYRNKGVFRALYNHVYNIAKNDPFVKALRLYVDTTNKNAI